MKVLAVIPARYASTRFPGKPLVDIKGKTMIQRVYEQVTQANWVTKVVVATDDERIFQHVKSFGGEVKMTAENHQSGTDRCAEVSLQFTDYEIVVNVQGDEPFLAPADIDQVIQPFLEQENLNITTLGTPIKDPANLFDVNVVKVVKAANQQALYFSRQAIPYLRNVPKENWLQQRSFYKHLGIYGFRRETLLALTQLPVSALEKAESLEQLRWLENGHAIHVGITENDSTGIDTPEDLENLLS